MAKITRFNLKPFGDSGPVGDFGQFGSLAAGAAAYTKDPAAIQSLAAWLTGWAAETIASNRPALEDFNAVDFLFGRALCYLMQAGIPEWEAGTTYYQNSFVQVSGIVYKSLTDDNTGNDPTSSPTNWQANPFTPVGAQVKKVVTELTGWSSYTGTIPYDGTIPQISEGSLIPGLTTAFQALAIGDYIDFNLNLTVTVNTGHCVVAIFRDSEPNAIAGFKRTLYWGCEQMIVNKRIAVTDLLSHTYTVRIGSSGSATTQYINGDTYIDVLGGIQTSTLAIAETKV